MKFIYLKNNIIADFIQLCSRLAIFRGEFVSVKCMETRNLFQGFFFRLYLKDTDIKEIHKSKQEIEPKIDTKKK